MISLILCATLAQSPEPELTREEARALIRAERYLYRRQQQRYNSYLARQRYYGLQRSMYQSCRPRVQQFIGPPVYNYRRSYSKQQTFLKQRYER
jgi:hypothetical protein